MRENKQKEIHICGGILEVAQTVPIDCGSPCGRSGERIIVRFGRGGGGADTVGEGGLGGNHKKGGESSARRAK